MQRKAFTLAEVLITLAIIGIVAAVTIPSVIANYQQQEFKTGLRKAVSVLNEAIQTNIVTEGETPYENANLYLYLKRSMSVLKTASGGITYINGGSGDSQLNWSGFGPSENMAFYTSDGMKFEFYLGDHGSKSLRLHESNENAFSKKIGKQVCGNYCYFPRSRSGFCGSYGLANNPNKTENTPCVIAVDVNGDRGPSPKRITDERFNNSMEYTTPAYVSPSDRRVSDVFSIMITEDRAIPFGVVAQRAMYEK